MWKLLTGRFGSHVFEGIVPRDFKITAQHELPCMFGIGFTDLGVEVFFSVLLIFCDFSQPGSDAAKFNRKDLLRWRKCLYARLRGHAYRVNFAVSAPEPNECVKPSCLYKLAKVPYESIHVKSACENNFPVVIAFTGQ
jgi:hypothetical protein